MSPKRRFLAALFRGPVDRPSVANPTSIATVELMGETGAFFPEAHLDAEKMATLAAGGHEILGYDTIAPIFSVVQEAAALGCQMNWGRKAEMPINTNSPIPEPEEVKIPEDFLERQPIRVTLDAISCLRHRYGDHVAIVGKVMGPWTLSYHMKGVQDFLLDIILDPDKVRRFLEALMPVTILYGKAQMQAGADVLVVADHCTGDLVRAETYRDFLLPYHQIITHELGCPTILHCCGKALDRMSYFAQAGFDGYHFESKNDPRASLEAVGGKISLVGNINNPQTLLQGTPEEVKREARAALRAGVKILAPECAVPCTTPNDNLKALVEAAEAFCQDGQ